jgi:hypothetical protein
MLVLRAVSQAIVDPTVTQSSPLWLSLAQMGAGLACGTTVWLTFAAPSFYKKMIGGGASA